VLPSRDRSVSSSGAGSRARSTAGSSSYCWIVALLSRGAVGLIMWRSLTVAYCDGTGAAAAELFGRLHARWADEAIAEWKQLPAGP
jgi:hypothetical protein